MRWPHRGKNGYAVGHQLRFVRVRAWPKNAMLVSSLLPPYMQLYIDSTDYHQAMLKGDPMANRSRPKKIRASYAHENHREGDTREQIPRAQQDHVIYQLEGLITIA